MSSKEPEEVEGVEGVGEEEEVNPGMSSSMISRLVELMFLVFHVSFCFDSFQTKKSLESRVFSSLTGL